MDNVTLGITGASGATLAARMIDFLAAKSNVALSVVATENGAGVFEYETGESLENFLKSKNISLFDSGDMFAPIASGSHQVRCMAIVPCSMGTVGKLASGVCDNLLVRAADVCLKERVPLIIVPRESPMHSVHLRNLATLSGLGAVIAPPFPAFYAGETALEDVYNAITGRILKCMGFKNTSYTPWRGIE